MNPSNCKGQSTAPWRAPKLSALILAATTYLVTVTVLEVIQRSTDFLAKKGADSPRLQAELLLAHVLRTRRLNLYLSFERKLAESELELVRELVRRRGQREPLQHIVGSTSFCGFEIKVNRHVLVPRPETELLAERACSGLLPCSGRPVSVLDVGTGSGCIAIALAAKCPGSEVHALDVSSEALAVARSNAASNGVADRIQFHEGDGLHSLPADLNFDLVVSNPPYIPTAEIEALPPEVRDHEPRLALDGGEDGLRFFRRLAVEAPARLRSGGRILVEFGDGQGERIREIFTRHNWIVEGLEPDYSGRARILSAHH